MRYIALAFLLCIATPAYAERIRDMSLSPEETAREPDVEVQHDYLNQNSPNSWSTSTPAFSNPGMDVPGSITPASTFMQGYCDPSLRPVVKLKPCFEATRQRACDLFIGLPTDAQNLLERDMACAHFAGEWNGEERNSEVLQSMHEHRCDDLDVNRVELLKQYWTDVDTAYALVFIPDMIINPTGFCSGGGY